PVAAVRGGEEPRPRRLPGGDARPDRVEPPEPVRVTGGDAGVDAVEPGVRRSGEDQVVAVEAADEPDELPRPRGRSAAAVEEIPAENGRVVLVRHVRVDVDVLEERPDMLLDVADHRLVRPERVHCDQAAAGGAEAAPAQVDAAAAARARVVADDRGDD